MLDAGGGEEEEKAFPSLEMKEKNKDLWDKKGLHVISKANFTENFVNHLYLITLYWKGAQK